MSMHRWIGSVLMLLALVVPTPRAHAQGIGVNEAQQLRTLLGAALENGQFARVLDYALALISAGYETDDITSAMEASLSGMGIAAAEDLVTAVLSDTPQQILVNRGVARLLVVELVDLPTAWRTDAAEGIANAALEQLRATVDVGDAALLLRLRDALGGLVDEQASGTTRSYAVLWFGDLPRQLELQLAGTSVSVLMGTDGTYRHAFSFGTLAIPAATQRGTQFYVVRGDGGPVPIEPGQHLMPAGAQRVIVRLAADGVDVPLPVDVPVGGVGTVRLPSVLAVRTPAACTAVRFGGLGGASVLAEGVFEMSGLTSGRGAVCCAGYEPIVVAWQDASPGGVQRVELTSQMLVVPNAVRVAERRQRLRRWGATLGGLAIVPIGYGASQLGSAGDGRQAFSNTADATSARAIAADVEAYDQRGRAAMIGGSMTFGLGTALVLAGSLGSPSASADADACGP